MIIGACQVDLHIPGSHSLKEKRQVLKRITGQVRNRFNVSISEIGDTGLWQRAQLGFVAVGNEKLHVESMLTNVLKFIERNSEIQILDEIKEYL